MAVVNPYITYNIDKLPLEILAMINILFKGEIKGFEDVYMVEIKLDDPVKHIEQGGEGFIIHVGSNQYQSQAKHLWQDEWCVIHKSIFERITTIDEDRFTKLLKKYLDTGELYFPKIEKNNLKRK